MFNFKRMFVTYVLFAGLVFANDAIGADKKIIYTAFDGDHILSIDAMRSRIMREGKLALNPEHVLGYYVSTHAHADKKFDVMRDCLALVDAAEEFSIFVDGDHQELPISTFSEGILVEILYYLQKKQGAATIYWEMIDRCYEKREEPLKSISLDIPTFQELLGKRFNGIESSLQKLTAKPLPLLVHIAMSDKNIKYADWVRIVTYERGFVPIIPQLIMPKSAYLVEGYLGCYQEDYAALQSSIKSKWFIVSDVNEREEFHNHYRNMGYESNDIRDFNVPKYVSPKNWSLTQEESLEIIQQAPEFSKEMREIVKDGYEKGCYLKKFRSVNTMNATQKQFLQRFVALVSPSGTVVDLGCGSGVPFDRYLVDRGFHVMGYDFSEKHIREAEKNVPEAIYKNADFTDFEADLENVDAFLALYSIFHIPKEEHRALFSKMWRALKPGGVILMTLGTDKTEYKDSDFCGADRMLWSNYKPEYYRQMLSDLSFDILCDQFESFPGDKENHYWVLIQKS
jgi:SAM-dependent methyltransferase